MVTVDTGHINILWQCNIYTSGNHDMSLFLGIGYSGHSELNGSLDTSVTWSQWTHWSRGYIIKIEIRMIWVLVTMDRCQFFKT